MIIIYVQDAQVRELNMEGWLHAGADAPSAARSGLFVCRHHPGGRRVSDIQILITVSIGVVAWMGLVSCRIQRRQTITLLEFLGHLMFVSFLVLAGFLYNRILN